MLAAPPHASLSDDDWEAVSAMARQFPAKRIGAAGRGMIAASLLFFAWSAQSRAADVELGKYLSSECMTCHGKASGTSTIPNIFGLGEGHFVEVIRAYRVKALPNPIMQSVAERLNDEEIAALAAYFATAKN